MKKFNSSNKYNTLKFNIPKLTIYFIIILIVIFNFSCFILQKPIIYRINLNNKKHHEVAITIEYPITLFMLELHISRTSPGRYGMHNFAQNIYNIAAYNSKGKKLITNQPNPYQWNISNPFGKITVKYTLFGDTLNGTYCAIDSNYVLLNPPAAFLWAKGYQNYPIRIKIENNEKNWSVATQLPAVKENSEYQAENFEYFMDSPIEIADFIERKWQMTSDNQNYSFYLYVIHNGTENQIDAFVKMILPVINEQISIFGELPEFDYGEYKFITNYLPWAEPDGMEHRNSAILTRNNSFNNYSVKFVSTLSHEFFHSWNVERLRPKSIEPFNFIDSNISGELWFAEGTTVYYDRLLLKRAGIITIEVYADNFYFHINRALNSPAAKIYSPVQMSKRAFLFDNGDYADINSFKNSYIHYFELGHITALGLDLTLRSRFKNISLDDLMRAMWLKYGRTEKPYTNQNIQTTLSEITKDPAFVKDFFNRYIYGPELPDYKMLFTKAGFVLRKLNPGQASIGEVEIYFSRNRAVINTYTLKDTALYNAGLDYLDEIITIDGYPGKYIYRVINRHSPGDKVKITYEHRGKILNTQLIFDEDNELVVDTYEQMRMPITDEIKSFRKSWLESKPFTAIKNK